MIIHRKTSNSTRVYASSRGMALMEVAVAMSLAGFLALMVLKGSLLAVSSNQWTIMQALSDAYMTRETALSKRIPMADLTAVPSQWPDNNVDSPSQSVQTVTIGTLPGGIVVQGQLTRFRINETQVANADTSITVWRLYSVLTYRVGENQYVKTRSTLRTQ